MIPDPITRFIKATDVVTHFKVLKTAAEECDDYEWMRAGEDAYICQHGEQIYPLLFRNVDGVLEVACGCPAWQFAKGNDGCKHVATYLKRSTPPQKNITDEIARDLIAAGWTGGKGDLQPPETTSAEPPQRKPVPAPGLGEKIYSRSCPHCDERIEGTDLDDVKRQHREHIATCPENPANKATGAENATVEPEPEIFTYPDGKEFKSLEAMKEYADEQEKIAQTNEKKQEEDAKMTEPETKIYKHPDGSIFETAEALMDYNTEIQEAEQVIENNTAATFELAPMIKGIRPQMRERGRITIGKKGAANASGRGRKTVRFDHFVFTTIDKDEKTDDYILDDAMNERYGKDCREIPVRFLSDNITEIFHTSYMKYTASGLKLMGDGENWIQYNSDGTRTYITDPNGEHGFLDDPDVKPHGILTVLVDGQESVGSVYRWRTTGWNSINGMLASLALCSEIAKRSGGRIAFMPMMLVYSTKWVTPKGQATKKKIPVITCEFRGTVEQLQERSREAMQYLSAPGAVDVVQLMGANAYDVDAETLEEQKDVAGEFAPGVA